ncbi:MAG: L-seryl-tRNA(Sec) selenium transferase [Acidobacteria bacterium]|nr:MAG: L-seryl-tRNA(Sec) selenium transferase [Acidobacteriota bacterium]
MANPQAAELSAALRMLPSTDELLSTGEVGRLLPEVGRARAAVLVRLAIGELRLELAADINSRSGRTEAYSRESLLTSALRKFDDLWRQCRRSRLQRVINVTGVVIHTNLGRAPLSKHAIEAMVDSSGYCTLEYDLENGKRGRRGDDVEKLIAEITGAEGALVVNNCAAAAYLVLTVFANGGEVVVSRGELVEIGGDFRVPDVLSQSGATLREIGTTNRTKLSDYERAINENTTVVMRVHPSNYKIVGFTDKPELAELAELTRKRGVLLFEDAGSGALIDLERFGLDDEPLISRSVSGGVDLVTFSGDKLLGGAQAGIIVGRGNLIEQIRKHPLYRALRVSKIVYAALGATLESYLREDAETTVPVLRMLGLTRDEIKARAKRFVERLGETQMSGIEIELVEGGSVVGGGSAPGVERETMLIGINSSQSSPSEIEKLFRSAETPVIARIENDRVLIDLRTVDEREEELLLEILKSTLQAASRSGTQSHS